MNLKNLNRNKMERELKVGDKIQVKTRLGFKLCSVDEISTKDVHIKNKTLALTVNSERIQYMSKSWRGANFYYQSFN